MSADPGTNFDSTNPNAHLAKLHQTQSFRDTMLEFVAETRVNFREVRRELGEQRTDITAIRTQLSSGEACTAGARHETRIDGLQRELNGLRKPTKKAAGIALGVGGGAGVIVAILNWLRENWDWIVGAKP